MLLAAPFFTLFFVPVVRLGSFSLDANLVSVVSFCLLAALNFSRIVANRFIFGFVILPWITILIAYLLSMLFLGQRHSFAPFAAQCIFLAASLGLASQLDIWLMSANGSKRLLRFLLLSSISLVISLALFAPPAALSAMLQAFMALRPAEVINWTRHAFLPDAFRNNLPVETITNYQNRVAQFLFSYAFFQYAALQFAKQRCHISRTNRIWLTAFPISLVCFSITLLSGQALAEILIAVAATAAAYLLLRPSARMVVTLLAALVTSVAGIVALLMTDLGALWMHRFTSRDISTGRVTRWEHYFNSREPLTPFGLEQSQSLDPHNMFVTMLYDAGVIAWVAAAVFAAALVARAVASLSACTRRLGLPFVLCMSVGFQMVFVISISGGYGFPSWAEFSKFSLFLLGCLMTGSRRAAGARRTGVEMPIAPQSKACVSPFGPQSAQITGQIAGEPDSGELPRPHAGSPCPGRA